jgi:uncharacterized protein
MRAVVSDTSPLVYLTRLGHLDWLRAIYGSVILPHAVSQEVTVGGKNLPESHAVRGAIADGWMSVRVPSRAAALPFDVELDPGETEAIALAVELEAVLIIDEMAGRQVAKEMGLSITGTVGVMLAANLRGLCASLAGELDRLETETTFWLSNELRSDLLRQAGEDDKS